MTRKCHPSCEIARHGESSFGTREENEADFMYISGTASANEFRFSSIAKDAAALGRENRGMIPFSSPCLPGVLSSVGLLRPCNKRLYCNSAIAHDDLRTLLQLPSTFLSSLPFATFRDFDKWAPRDGGAQSIAFFFVKTCQRNGVASHRSQRLFPVVWPRIMLPVRN